MVKKFLKHIVENVENRVENMIKPFLKWAGGKGKIVEEIVEHIEEDGRDWFPSENNRYFEPFFGGGALC